MFQDAAQRFLEGTLVPFLPKLAAAVAILLVCWLAGAMTKRIIRGFAGVHRLDESLAHFLSRTASVVLWIVGIVMALGTVHIDATALVAGLGLTGFAVGFALKDVISNTLAGILIIIYKPFGTGDTIKVSAFEGQVRQIDLRYTMLEAEGRRIYVPNSMLFSNAVTVITPQEGST